MAISTYLANKLLDHQLGKASYTMPTVYVGLSTTLPTVGGTNVTEPSGGSYARVATSGSTWNSASAGSISNSTTITFATPTADWGTCSYAVLYDASTAGNMLGFATLTNGGSVPTGVVVSIAAGSATVTLS